MATANPGASNAAAVSPDSNKTRAQVRAELMQAGVAGLIPVHGFDYPPSAATNARNGERFLQLEQVWGANALHATGE